MIILIQGANHNKEAEEIEGDKEKVLLKLRKILAVANRTTYEAEAQTAFLKAQQLMVEHGLSMEEVADQPPEKRELAFETVEEAKRRRVMWHGVLARIIGDNFRCTAMWDRRHAGYALVFIGLTSDAKIAREVYEAARGAGERLSTGYVDWRQFREFTIDKTATRNTYLAGFTTGLRKKFSDQVAANCWAMAIVLPEEVKEKVAELNLKKTPASEAKRSEDAHAFREGRLAGYSFEANKKLGEG